MKICYLTLFLALAVPSTILAQGEAAAPILDNSFLIEEAYNQEPGVVQNVSFYNIDPESDSWEFTFTQEIPIASQAHQFSYTIPVARMNSAAEAEEQNFESGLGDIQLTYRHQAIFTEQLALAPRFTLYLPTGEEEEGLGNGTLGYQAALPLSVRLNEKLVAHWNIGLTVVPDSKGPDSITASTNSSFFGASVVYELSPEFNFLLETLSTSEEIVAAETTSNTTREESFFFSPGFRFAINFPPGLQIVPGAAIPLGFGPSEGEFGLVFYLSVEDAFW